MHTLDEYKTIKKYLNIKCKCDCGKICWVPCYKIKNQMIQSCGCDSKYKKSKDKIMPAKRALYNSYIKRALKRNIDWSLEFNEFLKISSLNCHYCGNKPNNKSKNYYNDNYSYIYNGIDRSDNTQGYYSENCVPCCKICNRAKGDLKEQEFKEWIKNISKNLT